MDAVGRFMLRLAGVAVIAVGVVVFHRALGDIVDLPSCDERIGRNGKQVGADCAPGTAEATLKIVGAAFAAFAGLALDRLGRRGRDGVGIVLPLTFAVWIGAGVAALWPHHRAIAIVILVPAVLTAVLVARYAARERSVRVAPGITVH